MLKNTGMRGMATNERNGLRNIIADIVVPVATIVRRIDGKRSEPKYEISSIGPLKGYNISPTGVRSW
jgi:hypothetical protein